MRDPGIARQHAGYDWPQPLASPFHRNWLQFRSVQTPELCCLIWLKPSSSEPASIHDSQRRPCSRHPHVPIIGQPEIRRTGRFATNTPTTPRSGRMAPHTRHDNPRLVSLLSRHFSLQPLHNSRLNTTYNLCVTTLFSNQLTVTRY